MEAKRGHALINCTVERSRNRLRSRQMISLEQRALQPENLGPYARQNFLGPNLLDEEAAVKFAMACHILHPRIYQVKQ